MTRIARAVACFLSIFAPACCIAAAQTGVSAPGTDSSADPGHFIRTAADAMSLTAQEMKPWHLRAKYQDFDRDGSVRHEGVFEEWWAGPEKFKIHYTQADFDQTIYRVSKDTLLSGAPEWPSLTEFRAAQLLLHPLPPASALEDATFTVKDVAAGAAKLRCLTAVPKVNDDPQITSRVFCFVAPLPVLRVEEGGPGGRTSYNGIVRLNGHYIARQVRSLTAKEIPGFNVDVDIAEPLMVVDEAAFAPPADAKLVPPWNGSFADGVKPGHPVASSMPQYPKIARDARVGGSVLLHGVVGKDGTVKDLVVVSGPGMLQQAALDAART